jgi:fructose-1,6-bisphosphatase/inositol monophosphatase family enzyme
MFDGKPMRAAWTVRGYSACYDVAMLARGKADIWLSGNGMEWDCAPAANVR